MIRRRKLFWPLGFVLAIGVVSLFADANYEGGRGLAGPFLLFLGAIPLGIGFLSGIIEFFQFGGRWIGGAWAQSGNHPWRVLVTGYALNLFALPALVYVHAVWAAVLLFACERLGRGIRNPVKNRLLSIAGSGMGHGKAFGVYEILDQTGAVIGPLFLTVWLLTHSLRTAFALLVVPAVLAMVFLVVAYRFSPAEAACLPTDGGGEKAGKQTEEKGNRRSFLRWATVLSAAGGSYLFIGYALMAGWHWTASAVAGGFALVMACDGLGGLAAGVLYDRIGRPMLSVLPLFLAFSMGLLFWGEGPLLWLGLALWGVQLGCQETLVPADFGSRQPRPDSRAFGSLGFLLGVGQLAGTAILGLLFALAPALIPAWIAGLCVMVGIWVFRDLRSADRAPAS